MSYEFVEGNLRFVFEDSWEVVKYDDHPDFRNGLQRLKTSEAGDQDPKAMDFVGLIESQLTLVEVKDFREHRIETKPRVGGKLAKEVALKVRDTVAGVIGAHRCSSNPSSWKNYATALARRAPAIHVLLWLEEDRRYPSPTARNRHKQAQSVLAQQLKAACRWLTTKAFVVDGLTFGGSLPKLRVENMPRER